MPKLKQTMQNFVGTLDCYGEAIAYAEAGELELAGETLRRGNGHTRMLMVVCEENYWEEQLARKATGLAGRMGDAVMLVNINNVEKRPDANATMGKWDDMAHQSGVVLYSCSVERSLLASIVNSISRVDMVICSGKEIVDHIGRLSVPVYCLA